MEEALFARYNENNENIEEENQMAIEIGQKAPDFSAWVCDGEKFQPFKLSEQLGKENLVLAFFPFAFSSVCTNEVCKFRDDYAIFGKLNAQVFAISIDSPFTLNAFIKAQNLNFKLLSDFNKSVSRAYGALHEDLAGFMGVSKRSIFVLEKTGKVLYRWISDDPKVMPDFAEVQKSLKAAQK